ncbi:MAG TPA: alpha/beta hydrolase, partial [Chthoniobacterales bacterium]|nr:alpha/beta hydrolase [Chthoniobacterales bacterium]
KRVKAVAIVSGAPPIVDLRDHSGLLVLYRRMIWLYRNAPQLLRLFFYVTGALASFRLPPRLRPLMLKMLRLRACDSQSLEDTVAFEACFESQRRAWLSSVRGLIHDAEIFGKPWEFRLEDVNVPVQLWHGSEDRAFSTEVAKYVASRLPNCETHFVTGEGHYSLAIRHMREILSRLVDNSEWRDVAPINLGHDSASPAG